MKITNVLHFTENHRFTVCRDFSLGSLDRKMLQSMYQPMIGPGAIALFHTLYSQLPGEKSGYSQLEQQRRLFLQMELEQGEKGRKQLIEWSSKLEAVGLLSTTRRLFPESEEYVYSYQLYAPLSPHEFFLNQHLALLLRDKVGKIMLLLLRDELLAEEPPELSGSVSEQLSVPFYDLFRLNTQVMDHQLEQALYETAAAGHQATGGFNTDSRGFAYTDIIARFPKGSRNRPFVEALQFRKEHLVAINIAKSKYNLELQETCRLLDEDGIFDVEGNLMYEELQYRANLLYRQAKRRGEWTERKVLQLAEPAGVQDGSSEEVPAEELGVQMEYYLEVPSLFQGQCDVHQYNMLLRNHPYTLVLKKFFPQGTVPDGVLDIFERIDLNYGLPEEVINVLIHFIHTDRRSWAKNSIEAVAADLLGKQVATYEQAVEYIREKARYKAKASAAAVKRKEGPPVPQGSSPGGGRGAQNGSRGASGRGAKQKPVIPVAADKPGRKPLSDEEMEAIIRKASKWEDKKA
ncbi:MAG: replication initiation and rane attachment protein DnaB/DnaD family [Paenibacillaceae bacterium]|jgi:replication initiation and membrane attachment protein|nr:replication initiation and rane attachment protein DnaB/DnaD family [Paenibacillaceae bacterium]